MTNEQIDIFYRATLERDQSFDGVFFLGVKTTGIYCRPICPAPKPKRKNTVWFAGVAEAIAAGFRPCKRCRPETVPGSPAWQGTKTTVSRALRLIADGYLSAEKSEALADKLGITDRHLRRLFAKHLGYSPVEAMNRHRMALVKNMLTATNMSILDIAMQAGFTSLRRFNQVFKETEGMNPKAWRHEHNKDLSIC